MYFVPTITIHRTRPSSHFGQPYNSHTNPFDSENIDKYIPGRERSNANFTTFRHRWKKREKKKYHKLSLPLWLISHLKKLSLFKFSIFPSTSMQECRKYSFCVSYPENITKTLFKQRYTNCFGCAEAP